MTDLEVSPKQFAYPRLFYLESSIWEGDLKMSVTLYINNYISTKPSKSKGDEIPLQRGVLERHAYGQTSNLQPPATTAAGQRSFLGSRLAPFLGRPRRALWPWSDIYGMADLPAAGDWRQTLW